ncbi:hypothetical protein BDV28DRAFT_1440 [Aspergillus coremiiformis]|uniref:Uncharacterized protein n=1 Tax=Aspergillus coremiiformis TaxID=138285 RepID=A0A5N6ZH94_9EURO|nr:hypothetical protein BDV28DRAFT_1440 [Aspergillus coremiiformis]
MPPRRPVSPLSLETCSPPTSNLDIDGILGSDDELNEQERAAQRRRIEKLAESYLQGKPLFILSASLRGPLDRGWVNPWKKKRKPSSTSSRKTSQPSKATEIPASPVIHETNSRKRRAHHEPLEVRSLRSHTVAPDSNIYVSDCSRNVSTRLVGLNDKRNMKSLSPSAPRRSIPWAKAIGSNAQLHSSRLVEHTEGHWLKKDRKQISFQNVDPPTSPTATFSSRYSTKSRASRDAPVNSQATSSADEEQSPLSSPSGSGSNSPAVNRASNSVTSSPAKDQRVSSLVIKKVTSGPAVQDPSFCVLAPSSHLPQFEYRRKKPRVSGATESPKFPATIDLEVGRDIRPSVFAKGVEPSGQHESPPQATPLVDHNRHDRPEVAQSPKGIFTSTSTTNAIRNISVSHSVKFQSTSTANKGNTVERLPSAQQVRGNPTMTDITSLHSIAAPRSNSEYDGDTIPDPQFSTQAALLHAQRSFQNDLNSPEHDIASPGKQHASYASNISSPVSNHATPSRRATTPDRVGKSSRFGALATAEGQWQSTQCMIDAATPFTFSTEKKASRRTISSVKHRTGRKSPKITSFQLSSPSLMSSEAHFEQDDNDVHSNPVPRQSHGHETQCSALPMTLTGTTPPTAQERQQGIPGADSFNLTEAIADAGSWLQQSFDLNIDLQQRRISKSNPPSSACTQRSAVSVDGNK